MLHNMHITSCIQHLSLVGIAVFGEKFQRSCLIGNSLFSKLYAIYYAMAYIQFISYKCYPEQIPIINDRFSISTPNCEIYYI